MGKKVSNERFSINEVGLILVVILVLCIVVLMAVHVGSSSGQVAPTWTPRPTGPPVTLTPWAYLPLVENSVTPTR